MSRIFVHGSHGTLTVERNSGRVLHYDPEGNDPVYADIVRVHVAEYLTWLRAQGESIHGERHADILDVGFWTWSTYGTGWVAPDADHRAGDW